MKPFNCDILDLRLLADLCSTKSLKATSYNFNLSSAAVSRRITLLRGALPCHGDSLFIRSGNDFVPTSWMTSALPEIKKALLILENAFQGPVFEPAEMDRTFHFAAVDQAVLTILLPAVTEILVRSPNSKFSIQHLQAPAATMAALRAGKLDIALMPNIELPADILHLDLYAAHFSLLVRRGHPLQAGRKRAAGPVSKEDLSAYREIKFKMAYKARHPQGEQRSAAITTEFQNVVPYFLEKTDFYYVGPTKLCKMFCQTFDLAMLPIDWQPFSFPRRIVWHASTNTDPALQYIRSLIYSESRKLTDQA